MTVDLDLVVEKAQNGDSEAINEIIVQIKDLVYNLSLKMLLFPEDAKDATQEILIKIISKIDSFKRQSQFKTWVYRVATNYLLDVRGKSSQQFTMSFDDYALMIDSGQRTSVYSKNLGELNLLEEEVKISCTHGLLQCLNKKNRLIYILADILQFDSVEGAEILDMSAQNFRKQLSRARNKIRYFLEDKCGLMNQKNPCRCNQKIDDLIDRGLIVPGSLRFAGASPRSIDLVDKIGNLERDLAIYRTTPDYETPQAVLGEVKEKIKVLD